MKKLIHNIIMISTLIVALIATSISASAASVTLVGPSVVRAGDTIQIKITIAEAGRNAIEGTLAYDSNQVTLSSVTTSMSGWKVETNGNIIMAYDENMTNPTKANSVVAVATFKVKSNVAAGTTLKIAMENTAVAASSTSYDIGTVTYSVNIAKPFSTVNTLSALTVDGYTLSPAFKADTTSYDIGEVEFSVKSLNITATPTDSGAKATISGNSLVVGKNTVTITVKAENGSTKAYKINVIRKQDPNYKESNNANISKVTVSQGKVSPSFTPDNTKYVVYVPYESIGSSFEVSGTAQDSKAKGVTKGFIESLKEGVNEAILKCTAEDGTTKEYIISVVVMPKYEGVIPNIEGVEVTTEEPTTEEVTTEEQTTTEENTTTQSETNNQPTNESNDDKDKNDENDKTDNSGVPMWLTIVIAVVSLGIGAGVCFVLTKKNGNKE